MGYVCNNCNFRSEKKMKECLYCERRESVERDKGAEELLNEVDKLLHG
jgi:primosomal protein N'